MSKSILEVAKQSDLFFMEKSPIHQTMLRLSNAMNELNIRFAIAGAMAGNAHGHRRTTADVDILIREEDLKRFKERWIGLGWTNIFEGSKNFRDAVTDVKTVSLLVGQYPGDGLPKPVSFPAPEEASQISEEGLPFLNLPTLLELKLASGMTAPHRPRDLDDVIQLIRVNQLPASYADKLNPYVREKFAELWQAAQVVEDY